MPRLASVVPTQGFSVAVEWAEGPRAGRRDTVDLAPDILTYRFYRPLRDNPHFFSTLHLVDDGAAIAWGDDESIDMPATAVERLAEQTMVAADFNRFLGRNHLTFDAAAAQLGISRRLVAYYAAGQPIPRHIALACERLDQVLAASVPSLSPTARTAQIPPSVGLSSLFAPRRQWPQSSPALWEFHPGQRILTGDEQATRQKMPRATRTGPSGVYLQ